MAAIFSMAPLEFDFNDFSSNIQGQNGKNIFNLLLEHSLIVSLVRQIKWNKLR